MKYNIIPKTGTRVSELGLGCEHVGPKDAKTVDSVVSAAVEGGVNLLELFMPQPDIRDRISRAIGPRRNDLLLMGHIGSCLTPDGQYCRSRDPALCEAFVDDFLRRYHTDWMDFGMFHYVDTPEDYAGVFDTSIADYAVRLREQGKVRFVGASSHNAETALRMVETGLLDVLLFSVNPAQDLLPNIVNDDYFVSETYSDIHTSELNPARRRLYERCAELGVGIIVMKALGCGRMLTSDNGLRRPLTPFECIHYANTRPGVASVLVGCTSTEQVAEMLAYESADRAQIQFADALEGVLSPKQGQCMYCNHCLPCPAGIDIAEAMRLIDTGDAEGIRRLAAGPKDCVQCGSCEENCPFGTPVRARFAEFSGEAPAGSTSGETAAGFTRIAPLCEGR